MYHSFCFPINFFKGIIIFLTLFAILILFNTPVQSQQAFCYPDCYDDYWEPLPPSPPFTHQITLPCGEPVIILYRTRIACGSFLDVFIEQIIFVNGYEGGQNCGQTMSIAHMLESAMSQLVYDNPMQYPPTDSSRDTCVPNYRVMVGGCWHPTFPVGPGDFNEGTEQPPVIDAPAGLLVPCVYISCCIKYFDVCYVNGVKVVIYNPKRSTPGECDYLSHPACYPACE